MPVTDVFVLREEMQLVVLMLHQHQPRQGIETLCLHAAGQNEGAL